MDIPVPESPHFRNLVATLMGLMFCAITVGTMEMIGHSWFPTPVTVEQQPEDENAPPAPSPFFMHASPAALVWVMTGWGLAVLVGCFVAGVLGAEQATFCCLVLSLFCAAMLTLVMLETPTPVWFRFVSPLSLVAGGLSGWWLAQRLLSYWKTLRVTSAENRDSDKDLS